MSHTFYCVGCDDFSHFSQQNGNCEKCGTWKEMLMTHDQNKHFRWACKWIVDHAIGPDANQPLDYVKACYEADSYFKDYVCKGASVETATKLFKLAREKYVESVATEQAGQNLKDVIKWRLSSDCMPNKEYTKTTVDIRACLHLIKLETNFDLVKSYLTSLM